MRQGFAALPPLHGRDRDLEVSRDLTPSRQSPAFHCASSTSFAASRIVPCDGARTSAGGRVGCGFERRRTAEQNGDRSRRRRAMRRLSCVLVAVAALMSSRLHATLDPSPMTKPLADLRDYNGTY